MIRKISILVIFTILLIGLPLIGAHLLGQSESLFVSFPPLTKPAEHQPFSWPVFMVYFLLAVGIIAAIVTAASRISPGFESVSLPVSMHFPRWGWGALAVLIISWSLAWTRLPCFEFFQRHTFIPLWFSYIVVANGLCFRQTGKCPMLHTPVYFLFLFLLSAVFWWYFEYLNQFVRNWYYTGVDYGPITYSIHATISFSTVLPAVYTTRIWLSETKWFKQRFDGFPPLRKSGSILFTWVILLVTCAGLIGVSLWPDELFSLLWIAPLLILTSLQRIAGQTSIFSAMADGDWRPAISAALAALICGFLWEMWNYYSLAKWIYNVPYVHRFKIFEMPILGYMGYLPFGLECIAIAEFFEHQDLSGKKN